MYLIQRVLAWNDRDQISEIPWADLSGLETLAIAEGTVLLRSIPSKPAMSWLGNAGTQHPVEDFPIPPRVAQTRPDRSRGWEYVNDDGSAVEEGEDADDGSKDHATGKRKELSPAATAAAGGDGGAEQEQQQEDGGVSQKAAKRRASRRPGAGVRTSPVGSGGKLGFGGPGAGGFADQVM